MSERKPTCPYWESVFDDKEQLSKHIDLIHGDLGILEVSTKGI